MTMANWVFIEGTESGPGEPALEVLSKAASHGETVAIYLGEASEQALTELGRYGASAVYVLTGGGGLPAASVSIALAGLIEQEAPEAVLFAQTYTSRDVAGRLAARINRPVIANAVDVAFESGYQVTSELFGGTKLVETSFTAPGPALVLVRPKSFAAEPRGGTVGQVVEHQLPDAGHAGSAEVLGSKVEQAEGPQLGSAKVIISGGRGLGDAEAYSLIEEVAEPIGAATGATRAIVDAGWVPYSKQVGQTGKTVKPEVYIACGVSGAMQHMVGMKDSKRIVAINKDPEAPIFSVADLGIVGDVHNVLPKLAEVLRGR